MQLRRQNGFTLVELTIALAIFSALLLVMTSGVLQLYRIYQAGHEIRDTQEAARTVTQAITDDTHNSLAVAVNTPASPPGSPSAICLYQTVQQLTNTLTGVEYYVAAHDTNGTPLSGSLAVHRADVSTPYTIGVAPGCPSPAAGGHDTVLTSNAVIVHAFQAAAVAPAAPAVIPELITLKMSVESAYAQQPGDYQDDLLNPGFHQCVAQVNSQYCSITDIQMAALGHAGASQ